MEELELVVQDVKQESTYITEQSWVTQVLKGMQCTGQTDVGGE